jgi:hypothetical protein
LDEQYADWRERVCNRRRHATGGFWVNERLDVERHALRPLPPICFDSAGRRSTRVPLDGYLKLGGCFYRAPEPLIHQRVELRHDRDRVWISQTLYHRRRDETSSTVSMLTPAGDALDVSALCEAAADARPAGRSAPARVRHSAVETLPIGFRFTSRRRLPAAKRIRQGRCRFRASSSHASQQAEGRRRGGGYAAADVGPARPAFARSFWAISAISSGA